MDQTSNLIWFKVFTQRIHYQKVFFHASFALPLYSTASFEKIKTVQTLNINDKSSHCHESFCGLFVDYTAYNTIRNWTYIIHMNVYRTQTFIPSTTHIFSPNRTEEAVMKLRNLYTSTIWILLHKTSSVFVHTVILFFLNEIFQ